MFVLLRQINKFLVLNTHAGTQICPVANDVKQIRS